MRTFFIFIIDDCQSWADTLVTPNAALSAPDLFSAVSHNQKYLAIGLACVDVWVNVACVDVWVNVWVNAWVHVWRQGLQLVSS